MKLESITLTNFRQFYGQQSIKFARDPVKNVTVIGGVNGAGKTSILNALTWCLYGKKFENLGELANKKALIETAVGSILEAKVQTTFIHSGERYSAIRVLHAKRISKEEWDREKEAKLTLTIITSDGQFENVQNATGVVESILPSNVSSYFFFDGEKIDQFAKPGHEEDVKSAVKKVLKIEVLERAHYHLSKVAGEYNSEFRKQAPPEISAILAEQSQLQEKIEQSKEDLEKFRREKGAAENQRDEIDERLNEINIARDWVTKREATNAALKVKEQERDGVWMTIKETANRGASLVAMPIIESALKLLDEKRKKGEIPLGIREQFVKDLLEQGCCICGRPINKISNESEALKTLLGKSVSSQLENIVTQTAADLRALETNSSDLANSLLGAMKRKSEIDIEIEQFTQMLDEISRHLGNFDFEEVAILEKKRREYEAAILDLTGKYASTSTSIEQLRERKQTIDKEIEKAKLHLQKARDIQRRYTLANKAENAVERMVDAFASDMRQQIRDQAKQIFDKLVWKESQFQDIRISDDYSLEVLDRWGLPAKAELSAGERQVLSISFITGMSKVSGEEAPLVMDTPFGRLSSQPREKISLTLPEVTKQLVLLVTDEELHSQARLNIEKHIGAEYELVFDQSTGCTSIASVGN